MASSEPATAKPESTTEPSLPEEGEFLAELAAHTLEAFERRFRGKISWTLDVPGLVAIDDAATRQEAVILELLKAAFTERVRNAYLLHHHEIVRKQQLEDEERRNKEPPVYLKNMKDTVAEMVSAIEDQTHGRRHIKFDPKTEKEVAAMNLRLFGGPTQPESDDSSSSEESSGEGASSTATGAEEGAGKDSDGASDSPPPDS